MANMAKKINHSISMLIYVDNTFDVGPPIQLWTVWVLKSSSSSAGEVTKPQLWVQSRGARTSCSPASNLDSMVGVNSGLDILGWEMD